MENINVTNYLNQEGKLKSLIKVHSQVFEQSMKIVGFVPYNEIDGMQFQNPKINMNDDVIFTPYRMRLASLDKTFPIMQTVCKQTKAESFPIHRKLITPYDSGGFWKYYLELERGNKPLCIQHEAKEILKKVSKLSQVCDCPEMFINDDGLLMYQSSPEEFLFTRDYGSYTVLSNRFSCLCGYMNSVTGNPSYALFDPDELIVLVDNK